ncbi:putative sortase family protein [Actinoplanes missouriensis 431]|uniref:Putative sortase family protein n=1 Tax=Actinoplanes missouriensis (strain ATCC 14538 / DSM 43046 / CBS 188.64 / JCM 3121 / NBRC 102363 / NCIMB 12654 / NRRL B-3342 / UNCC 431) TaxID=512565 RepID=I0H1S0_ACTM4|nr:putative sortase family protein [Actinoplanes missouriensis 431]
MLVIVVAPEAPRAQGPPPVIAREPVRADRFRSESGTARVAEPVRLRIPELGVRSSLQRLGVQADGTIAVPEDPGVAGWYADGPRPGQAGPAVVLGHVDSRSGPGVFARLAGVAAGTSVLVDRADGTTVTFRISGVSRVSKEEFPTALVYAPTLDAALRLVTCGGEFDEGRGSYRDNVIVYAELV